MGETLDLIDGDDDSTVRGSVTGAIEGNIPVTGALCGNIPLLPDE